MSRVITGMFPGRLVTMAMTDENDVEYPDGQVALTFLVPGDVIVAAGEYVIARGDDR